MTTNLTSTLRYAVIAILACFSTTTVWAALAPVKSLSQLSNSKKYYIRNATTGGFIQFFTNTEDYTETYQVNATRLYNNPDAATAFNITDCGEGKYTISETVSEVEYYIVQSSTPHKDDDTKTYNWNTYPSTTPQTWTLSCDNGIFTISGTLGLWKAESQILKDSNQIGNFVYINGTEQDNSRWIIYEEELEVDLYQTSTDYTRPEINAVVNPLVTVYLYRSAMADGKSNTICLPFDMSAEQIADAFGEDARLYEFASYSGGRLTYTSATSIEAGVPYLITPGKPLYGDYYEIHNVNASSFIATAKYVNHNDFTFYGTFEKIEPAPSDIYTYTDGKFYHYAQASSISGFRAYFHSGNPQAKINTFAFEDETDGIAEIVEVLDKNSLGVYSVNGQLVRQTSDNLEGLTPGVYVVNGKKVLVK